MLFTSIAKLVALLGLAAYSAAVTDPGPRKTSVLVVFDPELISTPQDLVSKFSLDQERYELGFLEYSNNQILLVHNEKPVFDHVVYMPSVKKSPAAKSVTEKQKLLEYLNAGGNILAVGSVENSVPESVVKFLNEVGIYPAPKGHSLRSFFDKEISLSEENLASSKIVSQLAVPLYEGSAALISNSELLFPIVKAARLSFSANSQIDALTGDKTWTNGEQGFLAVGFQALNNARAAWVGSLDLVSQELVEWVFQEKKVLKLQFTEHYKRDEPEVNDRTLYRIKDEVAYSVGVSELKNDAWVPYTPASEDDVLQLSFKMLDPYHRLNLTLVGAKASSENGPVDTSVFAVNFTIPDHHGMFTFELDYMREGLSYLSDKKIVAVRHLANDEYERSWDITNSWVYITSAAVVVVAWLLFVANFLFLGEGSVKRVQKEKKEEKKE
ncbi:hypothetical protein PUMCH_003128 [Australozyma saopauloensis]|uniref:Dolichyl-diphosphooligosaccharide--protein glycosyltransferase subunit WBP1 n=1 Tax=Australozyma saopauloensis TaxID=291208 RepID=A0AAX4HD63_9ASCO|nr:hypothetical protein PUMCH_003128 [[Candida] saopauloensis]